MRTRERLYVFGSAALCLGIFLALNVASSTFPLEIESGTVIVVPPGAADPGAQKLLSRRAPTRLILPRSGNPDAIVNGKPIEIPRGQWGDRDCVTIRNRNETVVFYDSCGVNVVFMNLKGGWLRWLLS